MSDQGQDVTNIMMVGIGGQGVLTAAEVIAQAAISLGHDVKKTEVAGMAQRGGVVSSHVRFGTKVLSPSIPVGEGDLMVAFEPAEAKRWVGHMRAGSVCMVNSHRLTPPVVNTGLFQYPTDPIGDMKAHDLQVTAFDAAALAQALGDRRLVNTIMLGAISKSLPFGAEVLLEAIVARFRARKPEMVTLNETAFAVGQKAGEQASGTTEAA